MTDENIKAYNPHPANADILNLGLEFVNSVPYKASSRWLFYRLLQEGVYSRKEDYNDVFLPLTSRARKAFWNGWRPDTLTDDTREAIDNRHGEYENVAMAIDSLRDGVSMSLDHWFAQPFYCELWYEARAMTEQFKHYTDEITLRPFGGDPSIPYKWQAAKEIEKTSLKYGKPVVILYFGDLDTKGKSIGKSAERDIRKWCSVDFDFNRCGLTMEQVKRYGVPENFEKPGQYQWEALSDEGASEIIQTNFDRYVSREIIATSQGMSADLENEVGSLMAVIADELIKRHSKKGKKKGR